MTIMDLITRAAPALSNLAAQLEVISNKYPDLSADLAPKIAALRAAADPLALAQLGATVLTELTQFARTGTLDPRNSPSNLA